MKINRNFLIYTGIVVVGALILSPDIFSAEVEGVDKAIKGIATAIVPNFKFGTSVVSGAVGLGLLIAGLVKTSPRMLISGGCLAVVPAAVFTSIVGEAASLMVV